MAATIWQTGVRVSELGSGVTQITTQNGTVCTTLTTAAVKAVGDYVYVRDLCADGKSAVGRVWSPTGATDVRICRNSLGAGTWARCDFDWPEGIRLGISAGTYDANTGSQNGNFGAYFTG
jgi:hypothetical protein